VRSFSCYPELLPPSSLVPTRYAVIGGIARYLFESLLPNSMVGATFDIKQKQLAVLNDITVHNPLSIDKGKFHLSSNICGPRIIFNQQLYTAAGGVDHYRTAILFTWLLTGR
jgi:hypothetical protein